MLPVATYYVPSAQVSVPPMESNGRKNTYLRQAEPTHYIEVPRSPHRGGGQAVIVPQAYGPVPQPQSPATAQYYVANSYLVGGGQNILPGTFQPQPPPGSLQPSPRSIQPSPGTFQQPLQGSQLPPGSFQQPPLGTVQPTPGTFQPAPPKTVQSTPPGSISPARTVHMTYPGLPHHAQSHSVITSHSSTPHMFYNNPTSALHYYSQPHLVQPAANQIASNRLPDARNCVPSRTVHYMIPHPNMENQSKEGSPIIASKEVLVAPPVRGSPSVNQFDAEQELKARLTRSVVNLIREFGPELSVMDGKIINWFINLPASDRVYVVSPLQFTLNNTAFVVDGEYMSLSDEGRMLPQRPLTPQRPSNPNSPNIAKNVLETQNKFEKAASSHGITIDNPEIGNISNAVEYGEISDIEKFEWSGWESVLSQIPCSSTKSFSVDSYDSDDIPQYTEVCEPRQPLLFPCTETSNKAAAGSSQKTGSNIALPDDDSWDDDDLGDPNDLGDPSKSVDITDVIKHLELEVKTIKKEDLSSRTAMNYQAKVIILQALVGVKELLLEDIAEELSYHVKDELDSTDIGESINNFLKEDESEMIQFSPIKRDCNGNESIGTKDAMLESQPELADAVVNVDSTPGDMNKVSCETPPITGHGDTITKSLKKNNLRIPSPKEFNFNKPLSSVSPPPRPVTDIQHVALCAQAAEFIPKSSPIGSPKRHTISPLATHTSPSVNDHVLVISKPVKPELNPNVMEFRPKATVKCMTKSVSTNTRRIRTCEFMSQTDGMSNRDVCLNTIESLFDETSQYQCDVKVLKDAITQSTVSVATKHVTCSPDYWQCNKSTNTDEDLLKDALVKMTKRAEAAEEKLRIIELQYGSAMRSIENELGRVKSLFGGSTTANTESVPNFQPQCTVMTTLSPEYQGLPTKVYPFVLGPSSKLSPTKPYMPEAGDTHLHTPKIKSSAVPPGLTNLQEPSARVKSIVVDKKMKSRIVKNLESLKQPIRKVEEVNEVIPERVDTPQKQQDADFDPVLYQQIIDDMLKNRPDLATNIPMVHMLAMQQLVAIQKTKALGTSILPGFLGNLPSAHVLENNPISSALAAPYFGIEDVGLTKLGSKDTASNVSSSNSSIYDTAESHNSTLNSVRIEGPHKARQSPVLSEKHLDTIRRYLPPLPTTNSQASIIRPIATKAASTVISAQGSDTGTKCQTNDIELNTRQTESCSIGPTVTATNARPQSPSPNNVSKQPTEYDDKLLRRTTSPTSSIESGSSQASNVWRRNLGSSVLRKPLRKPSTTIGSMELGMTVPVTLSRSVTSIPSSTTQPTSVSCSTTHAVGCSDTISSKCHTVPNFTTTLSPSFDFGGTHSKDDAQVFSFTSSRSTSTPPPLMPNTQWKNRSKSLTEQPMLPLVPTNTFDTQSRTKQPIQNAPNEKPFIFCETQESRKSADIFSVTSAPLLPQASDTQGRNRSKSLSGIETPQYKETKASEISEIDLPRKYMTSIVTIESDVHTDDTWIEVSSKRRHDSGHMPQPNTPSKPQSRPILPQSIQLKPSGDGKASNFDKLVKKILSNFPDIESHDVTNTILPAVRKRNANTLKGLSMETIMLWANDVVQAIRKARKPPQVVPTKDDFPALPGSAGNSLKAQAAFNAAIQPKHIPTTNKYDLLDNFLPSFVHDESSQNDGVECVICYGSMGSKNTRRLDCGHEFHTECIKRWVNDIGQRTCPNCRQLALFQDEYPKLGK